MDAKIWRNPTRLPVPTVSNIPKCCKKNTITADL